MVPAQPLIHGDYTATTATLGQETIAVISTRAFHHQATRHTLDTA
ncbi:hypothetical protein [Streptomyces tateyamensis]|nr:hypothetical protein [Streptomyces tateyamensis]